MKIISHKLTEKDKKQLTELKNVILAILIFTDFLFIITITFFKVSYDGILFMAFFDLLVCLLLFLELVNDYRNYKKGLKAFIKEHILDILALIPYNFIFLRYLAVYRLAKILQLMQIFKIMNYNKQSRGSLRFIIENGFLKLMLLILLLYLLFSSIILFKIDTSFPSIFEAFWFNIVTMTSVGYGDLTPASDAGRIIAMFSIVMGIMFVSVFTAAMSAVYMRKPEIERRKKYDEHMHEHIGRLVDENTRLQEEIGCLKKENREVNRKLDRIIELLDEEE